MGFFKNILSSAGLGGVQVDTVLSKSSVRVGKEIEGVVNIVGTSSRKTIDKVEVELKAECIKGTITTLVKLIVARAIEVGANETLQIPFGFTVPKHTPISMNTRNVWVETEVEIPLALDPEDRDYVEVRPSHAMEVVLDAMTNVLGFKLRKVQCKESNIQGSQGGFVQEFEFVPQTTFKSFLDEIEITFLPHNDGVNIFMQVDRKVRGVKSLFEEAAGLDETNVRFAITNQEAAQGSQYVAETLESVMRRYS